MIQRLNYYSRYNRIRAPRQIDTLYHLVGNLNLDGIISDDVIEKFSTLRQQNLIMRAQKRNQDESAWVSPTLQIEQKQSEEKRYVSWEKNTQRSSQDDRVKSRQKVNDKKRLKILTSRENQKHGEIQLFQSDKLNRNYIQIEEDVSEPKQMSIQENRSKTNNLSEIKCLETQSIPQTVKEDQLNLQSSFIMNKETFNENIRQQQPQQRSRDFEIPKNCQSQFFQTNRKEDQEHPKSSNFQDEFSEGLAELNKVDEIRKSTAQQNLPYDYSYNLDHQDYRSEKLERLYGSDFQIQLNDDIDHFAPYDQNQIDNYQEQLQDNIQIPIMINGSENLYEHENSFQDNPNFHFHNQQLNSYVHHEQQQEYEQEQQERNSANGQHHDEYISIDNQLAEGQVNRIPSNGLTQGNWPVANTQNSIESIDQSQEFYVPPITYVNRSQTNNSNINSQKQRKPFKRIMMGKKLNPRMVTSTFVNDPPVKKVNFKKVMKKQTIENITHQQLGISQQNKKIREVKPTEERRLLLKAFFDQN